MQKGQRTRDVVLQNIIFLDDIVYNLLAVFVHDKHLPLHGALAMVTGLVEETHITSRGVAYGVEDQRSLDIYHRIGSHGCLE